MEAESRPEYTSDDLARIIQQLSVDQVRFVVARQEFSTDKEAAMALELKPATVKQWKRRGAPIDQAVELIVLDGVIVARELRRKHLAKAMAVKVAGLDSDQERTRQNVSTEIIEWEMGKAAQKIEQSGDRNVNLHIVYDGPGPGHTSADTAPEAA